MRKSTQVRPIKSAGLYNLQNSEDIIREYLPLVKWIAHHLMGRLPATVLADDLIQTGVIGLIEAAKNFDATKGASFQTYAGIRIRGTILDEVRKHDWLPRSVYRRLRDIADITCKITNKTGRAAKDNEIAQALDMSVGEYHKILQDATNSRIFDYDETNGTNIKSEASLSNALFSNPIYGIETDDCHKALALSLQRLSEREQLVLSLYYYEDLNLKEIGQVLSVSESRVCQIHSQAMKKLRRYLSQHDIDDAA